MTTTNGDDDATPSQHHPDIPQPTPPMHGGGVRSPPPLAFSLLDDDDADADSNNDEHRSRRRRCGSDGAFVDDDDERSGGGGGGMTTPLAGGRRLRRVRGRDGATGASGGGSYSLVAVGGEGDDRDEDGVGGGISPMEIDHGGGNCFAIDSDDEEEGGAGSDRGGEGNGSSGEVRNGEMITMLADKKKEVEIHDGEAPPSPLTSTSSQPSSSAAWLNRHYETSNPAVQRFVQRLCILLTANLIRDGAVPRIRLRNYGTISFLDGPESARFLKFIIWNLILIVMLHPFVRLVGWENDEEYTLQDLFQYDMNMVLLDLSFFFLVGRMYRPGRSVDCILPYGLPFAIGATFSSWTNDFHFLRHSFSMYEVMCRWPWQLFAYILLLLVLGFAVVLMHVKHAVATRSLTPRLIELGVTVVAFIGPVASNPNFHLHHWFYSWLLGMHANADPWWSKVTMAFALGTYANGIAVYGRDPILGCADAYFRSTGLRCQYMQCYFEDDGGSLTKEGSGDESGGAQYKPFVAPNWRNCSAEENYIP